MPSQKQATVEEGSLSPKPVEQPPLPEENPPPPDEQPPLPAESSPLDTAPPLPTEGTPEASNDSKDAEGDDVWDPAAETSLKGRKAAEEKKSDATEDTGGWQAVWAPAANAYYFWNSKTNETTWTNPLVPPPSAPAAGSSSSTQPPLPNEQPPLPTENPPLPTEQPPLPQAPWGQAYGAPSSSTAAYSQAGVPADGGLPPIDPDLAHLLPREQRGGDGYQTAAFNSRTGRFTPANFQYTVDHLAEANRAKRQEGVFFDVQEWEQSREKEYQEKKRKEMEGGADDRGKAKLSKADMDRFRQKKQEKKARNNAWLRG